MDVKYLVPLLWLAMSGGFTVDDTGKIFKYLELFIWFILKFDICAKKFIWSESRTHHPVPELRRDQPLRRQHDADLQHRHHLDHPVLQPLVWPLSEVAVEWSSSTSSKRVCPCRISACLLTPPPYPEFYCRFAPIWKDLASDVKDWAPTVKIGAINCADQSCDRYQVVEDK